MPFNLKIKDLPNVITCANLFSGCVGLVFAFKGNLIFAAYAIFLSAILDFFDGLAARLLKAYTVIGKDLDSLADMVSFGVLPGSIIYELFLQAPEIKNISSWLNFTAFLIPVFSALRLAKFNTDTRQAENFIGLPTPANAILIASFPILVNDPTWRYQYYLLNTFVLSGFVITMCALLVIEIPLISLKFKNLKFKKNKYRYLLILLSVILLLFFKFAAVPVILFVYIILSIFQFKFSNKYEKIPG